MTAGASAHGRQTHQEHVGRWTEKDSTGGGQSEGHGVAPRAVWAGGGGGRKGRWQGQCGQVEAGLGVRWGQARPCPGGPHRVDAQCAEQPGLGRRVGGTRGEPRCAARAGASCGPLPR